MTPQEIYDLKQLIHDLSIQLEVYIKQDIEWKKDAAPVIEMGKSLNGFSTVVKWLFGIAISIGSIWLGIEYIANKIVHLPK